MSRKKPQKERQHSFPLDSSIDELESLIPDTGQTDEDNIPVLDDIVDPDTFDEADAAGSYIEWTEEMESWQDSISTRGLSPEQIELLVGKMDQRIAGELDELVNILKDAIKDSIITEIKTQLETRPQDNPADNSDPDKDG